YTNQIHKNIWRMAFSFFHSIFFSYHTQVFFPQELNPSNEVVAHLLQTPSDTTGERSDCFLSSFGFHLFSFSISYLLTYLISTSFNTDTHSISSSRYRIQYKPILN